MANLWLAKTVHQNPVAGFHCQMGTTEGADERQIADCSHMLNERQIAAAC
jgi:hypothetical protein